MLNDRVESASLKVLPIVRIVQVDGDVLGCASATIAGSTVLLGACKVE